ncbi:MAG: hypothetical protein ACK5KU_12165 [Beutenbergiaceae bacterium]
MADAALTTLYQTVEADFSSFYRQINDDDESSFKAGLSPTAGKLDLEVDFYGLGMFPPMAYHSEGHQDGMGVCPYLALIRQLLKSELAVLDDVVTSPRVSSLDVLSLGSTVGPSMGDRSTVKVVPSGLRSKPTSLATMFLAPLTSYGAIWSRP